MKFTYNHTVYGCYIGYITQAIVNNLAPLLFLIFRDSFGISLTKITLITTINFVIQLTVDAVSAVIVERIGYRVSVVIAHACSALGLIGMAVFPQILSDSYVGLLIAVFFYAIGGGLLEVLISPIVEACPSDNKEKAMSLLHSFYCWGTVAVVALSSLFLFVVGKNHWMYLPILWAIVPILNGLWFLKLPILRLNDGQKGMKLLELFRSPVFWLFGMIMVMAGASEQAMSQWASAFAESGLHISKFAGDLAGPCIFSILMGLSRTWYGKCGERVSLLKFMLGSAVLCVGSYLLAAFASIPALALVGCGICGLSVGIFWPGAFSLASKHLPRGGMAMFALLALFGDLGCSSGPTVVGMVAGAFHDNLKKGLFAAILFPIGMILCGLILAVYARNRSKAL